MTNGSAEIGCDCHHARENCAKTHRLHSGQQCELPAPVRCSTRTRLAPRRRQRLRNGIPCDGLRRLHRGLWRHLDGHRGLSSAGRIAWCAIRRPSVHMMVICSPALAHIA